MAYLAACQGVIENSQPGSCLQNRREAHHIRRPLTVSGIENDGLVRAVPLVQVLTPVDPYRVSVLMTILDSYVIGEKIPGPVLLLIKRRILDLFFRRNNGRGSGG